MPWLLGILLLAGPARAAEFDLPTLLARVARPVPDAIGFVEARYSRLLKAPLVVAGTLERAADGSLVRRIESPYRETTQVRGGDVSILREGAKPRTFSLARAPELAGLLGSIDGMLRGDPVVLERAFTSTLEGDAVHWRVRLVPRDEQLRHRLSDISVYGAETTAQCFAMNQPTGEANIIALGVSTASDVPHATREGLEAWCRGGRRS